MDASGGIPCNANGRNVDPTRLNPKESESNIPVTARAIVAQRRLCVKVFIALKSKIIHFTKGEVYDNGGAA